MGMTPGQQALQRYTNHAHHAMAVAIWDDLSGHGLRVLDGEAPADDRDSGVVLSLGKDGIYLDWQLDRDREHKIYDKTLRAEQARSISAVMTGAVASSLAALGYRVHADFADALPAPTLVVDDMPLRS
ncbi:hypothetical protein G7Z12_00300 [Streptomyces sp. ID38640]|uniref:hypothetical protein n=1 Tax=Streptomyces sp. ID38640 TaxID=1265399 RepID=UPI00140F33DD|nr:hypothetical protein [Streptomyces sp. ID38640]QIK04750.1 hypothetical protein G7Z12_00300 [Streptomyces sp. ID38640]